MNHDSIPDLGALKEIVPYLFAILALWFTNMALTGWVARRRGRDDGLWAVVAFLLGPVALAVVLLPRREQRDVLEGSPVTPQSYTGEWPLLTAPAPSITQAQRLLAALLGAGIGGAGAGVLATFGALQPVEVHLVIGAASGAILGYVLSGALLEADRMKLIGISVGAGFLVLSLAGLMIGLANAIPRVATGATGIEAIPLVLVTAPLYPIIFALFGQGVLAVSIGGATIWTAATHLMLRQRAPGVATP